MKAQIKSVMTYASRAWEFAAESHLLKLQRLQNRFLRTIGNFPRSAIYMWLSKFRTFMIS
jgi:hypothetical protein